LYYPEKGGTIKPPVVLYTLKMEELLNLLYCIIYTLRRAELLNLLAWSLICIICCSSNPTFIAQVFTVYFAYIYKTYKQEAVNQEYFDPIYFIFFKVIF